MSDWAWRYERADGSVVEGVEPSESFPAQADAESWIGETWAQLLEQGIDSVTLLEGERVVYGPMSLHPPA
jgi:hypothetical protein